MTKAIPRFSLLPLQTSFDGQDLSWSERFEIRSERLVPFSIKGTVASFHIVRSPYRGYIRRLPTPSTAYHFFSSHSNHQSNLQPRQQDSRARHSNTNPNESTTPKQVLYPSPRCALLLSSPPLPCSSPVVPLLRNPWPVLP